MNTVVKTSPLAAFGVRSFRFQWPADLLSSFAFEMEILILGWFVLVETRSVIVLTAFVSLQWLGTLLSPMFGVGSDRIGCRRMLFTMRVFYAFLAATIMTLGLLDSLLPTHVIAIALLGGLVKPSDIVMRNALIGHTVPEGHLMSAVGMARTTMAGARVVGAIAGPGLLALLGIGPAYVVVTTFYVLGFLLTLGVAGDHHKRDDVDLVKSQSSGARIATLPKSPYRDLKDGMLYVWSTPAVLACMWLAFLANMTAFPLSHGLLPYVAREIHQVGETGLAQLAASFAVGALAGSIGVALLGRQRHPARLMLAMIFAWYVSVIVFVQFDGFAAGMAVLVLVGIAHSMGMSAMDVVLITTIDGQFRGRAMGVRMFAIYGLPIGLLIAGVLIDGIGFRPTIILYAGIGILFMSLITYKWRAALLH